MPLHAEGLIAIVPRRYSVVTRMSREDAEAQAQLELTDVHLAVRAGGPPVLRQLLAADYVSGVR
jgi:DNA-binding GntR family transcriptional regulator